MAGLATARNFHSAAVGFSRCRRRSSIGFVGSRVLRLSWMNAACWLISMVESASPRIVTNAMQALLDEFPDEESYKLVEMRANSADIWYYHRIRIQGALARHFPTKSSSLKIVERSLREVDGPEIADFAGSYENHIALRSRIMASTIAAPEDVRMTIAATLCDQPVDAEAMQFLTPDVFAEESGSVRSATLIARARTTKRQ